MRLDDQDSTKPDVHSSTAEYRQRFAGPVGDWFVETQQNLVKEMLTKQGSGPLKVVEFGGGHAQNLAPLLASGFEVTVTGSDESCFELIREDNLSEAISSVVTDLCNASFADASFDAVLSFRMLAHLGDWQAHVKELCRVSNGYVLVEFPNKRSVNVLADRMFAIKKGVETNTRQYLLFDLAEVTHFFTQQGFELVRVEGQYVLPMALHRLLKWVSLSRFLERVFGVLFSPRRFGSPLVCLFKKAAD